MRVAGLAGAAAVGLVGLLVAGSPATVPAGSPPPGSPVLADVIVRPGVLHVGRAQAGPLSTADCEKLRYRLLRAGPGPAGV